MRHTISAVCILSLLISACQPADRSGTQINEDAAAFLTVYADSMQGLYYEAARAEWKLNTYIVEGDTVTPKLADEANAALAEYTGSEYNIEQARTFLEDRESLSELQVRQLEAILYEAGSNPAIAGDLVKRKIEAETEQTRKLFGFDFKINGTSVSTNDIDSILKESTSLDDRLEAWKASKEVGTALKGGLENLQALRNETVQALGYDDYFQYQISDYGYSVEELRDVCKNMVREIWPLYREIHTWARYTLADRYGQEVPEYLPAHWLPNRWGQDWSSLIEVEGFNVDSSLKERSAEWIMQSGEEFYKSMGMPALPQSFYEKSSLYPAPPDADWKKNNHASAWHMDIENDVRSLMSVVPNAEWWETVLHELGHIYYYMAYSNPDVPLVLREGANRAYHEAIGTLIGLASMQKPFLVQYDLVSKDAQVDQTKVLLKEALNYAVFIPWSAGVMTEFEDALYTGNLSKNQYNAKWWELKKTYQGIIPPEERGEEYCDAASKTHINNDAAQYYDYAMSFILLFQFHIHIAEEILQQDPHLANYYGSEETGEFLMNMMRPGASVDWREHLQKLVGSEMSASAMLAYFEPLMDYLKKENEGREYTLPAQFED
jgi:peptidyl-dipeptidase A